MKNTNITEQYVFEWMLSFFLSFFKVCLSSATYPRKEKCNQLAGVHFQTYLACYTCQGPDWYLKPEIGLEKPKILHLFIVLTFPAW